MIKKALMPVFLVFSIITGESEIKIKLVNGSSIEGEFVGTYMNHIHLLIKNKIQYFSCDDINSIKRTNGTRFIYDCNKNTVTADILFPPQINPMTGEWETILPAIFTNKKHKTTLQATPAFQVEPSNTKKTTTNTSQKKHKIPIGRSEASKEKVLDATMRFSATLSEKDIRTLIKEEVRKEVKRTLPYEIKKQKKKELKNRLQAYVIGCGVWFFFLMMVG